MRLTKCLAMARVLAESALPATTAGAAVAAKKAALRTQIKAALRSLHPTAIAASSAGVHAKLKTLPCYTDAKKVSAYLSMAKEVQTKPILEDLFAQSKRVFIPKVKGICCFLHCAEG
jgi:5-formyltetrahydrofolate cyclo-ligase